MPPAGKKLSSGKRAKSFKGQDSAPRIVSLQRDAAVAFLEADVDGNKRLSWQEFINVIPDRIRQGSSDKQLASIFHNVDQDHSGDISMVRR